MTKQKILSFLSKPWIAILFSAVLALSSHCLLFLFPLTAEQLNQIQKKIYDFQLRFRIAEENYETDDVVIITIDEKSISYLGQFSQWPNYYFADLVTYLKSGNAFAVGFDILFTESDDLTDFTKEYYRNRFKNLSLSEQKMDLLFQKMSSDTEFSDAMKNAENVYLAMFDAMGNKTEKKSNFKNLISYPKINTLNPVKIKNPKFPTDVLATAAHKIGYAHIQNDTDGIIRYFPIFFEHDNAFFINFSTQIAFDFLHIDSLFTNKNELILASKNKKTILPVTKKSNLLLHYYGKKKSFRYLSFVDVLRKRIPARYFKDKIVLVGASAFGLEDLKSTTTDRAVPGVEIHATLIQNIINQDFIHYASHFDYILLGLFLSLLVILLWKKSHYVFTSILFILGVGITFIVSFYYFNNRNTYLEIIPLLTFFFLFYGFNLIILFARQSKEKAVIKTTFEKYVAKTLVHQLLKDPSKVKQGGSLKEVTVLFTDIRGFTSMSEKLPPSEISDFLTEYLSICTQTIIDNMGFLDKYIGDAIVAIFGAPVSYENYQEKACLSALQIVHINKKLREKYKTHQTFNEINTGIGISSAKLVVGNLGSEQIYDYTAIGDGMNFGARLESLNKFYKTNILINQATFDTISEQFLCRKIDIVRVKGKENEENIYELLTYNSQAKFSELVMLKKEIYESAFSYYKDGNFSTARRILKYYLMLYEDKPALHLSNRIIKLIQDKIEHWDGVWVMQSK